MAAFAINNDLFDQTRTDFPWYEPDTDTTGFYVLRRTPKVVYLEVGGTDTTYHCYESPEPPRPNRHLTRKLKKFEKLNYSLKKQKELLYVKTNPYIENAFQENLTFPEIFVRLSPKRPRANLRAGRRPPMVGYMVERKRMNRRKA